jgi:hypothetical protein
MLPGQFSPMGFIARGFLPTDIPNCQLWVRADQGVSRDGSNLVGTWSDQSGNGRHFSEATNKPLWVSSLVNGQPAIRFDGTDDKLATADFAVSAPYHVFVVHKNLTATDLDSLFYFDNDAASTTPFRLAVNTPGPNLRIDANGNSGATISIDTTNFILVAAYLNGTSSYLTKNNEANATSGGNVGTLATDGMVLCARFSDRFHSAEIAEVVLYGGEITGTNLTRLQSYFKNRYGLWV